MENINCQFCGQCIQDCPQIALKTQENINDVYAKINDKNIVVFVQTAPSIRVALGEEFGMQIGTNVQGKMVTALRKLGFDKVFDTNTGADFTIVEEATEFINRIKTNGVLPMFTSCCPSWVKFIETKYPDMCKNLSTGKSPHEMLGAVIKTYYAKKYNINPEKIYNVSIMPCFAKKIEYKRPELKNNNLNNVDCVITTRELAKMIKQANIDFANLEDSEFDNPMGEGTGAGAIFGTSGGVMESALRTAQDFLTGKSLDYVEFDQVHGEIGIKSAIVNIGEKNYKVCVASGLGNAKKVVDGIKSGLYDFDFVEIMACPGGCIMGGGQPIETEQIKKLVDIKNLRSNCLYNIDKNKSIRKAHENPVLKEVYNIFLEKPGSKKAEEILHTKYLTM